MSTPRKGSNTMTRSLLSLTSSVEFKQRLSASFKKTAETRARLGLPKAVVVDGVVYKEYADGRRERVNKPVREAKSPDQPAKKIYSRTA